MGLGLYCPNTAISDQHAFEEANVSRIARMLALIVLALALLGYVSSCMKTPTPTPSESKPVTTPEPSTTPTATRPAPQPTATPNPCPAVRPQTTTPARPLNFGNDYVQALQDYLTAGGDPVSLAQVLQDWEALAPSGGLPIQNDFSGDGVPEIAVAFINPLAETFPPEGLLAVFTCAAQRYETLHVYTPGEWTNVALVGGEDATADNRADLIFADVTCGAHTCWHTLHVWSWKNGRFHERVDGEATLPYPTFAVVDGAVLARSTGIGSVGAGPQRVFTETWAWNGDVITRTSEELGPAEFRYHAFRDGDDAFRARRYADAFDAYLRVLNDETLDPWAGFYGAPEERLWFTALARWRLILLEMQMENTADAELQYDRLQSDFNAETPGYAVAAMARRFWESYQRLGLLPDACIEASTAPEVEAVLDFLNSFGYANPTYAPDDLCPLTTP